MTTTTFESINAKVINYVTNFKGMYSDFNGETATINMSIDNFNAEEKELLAELDGASLGGFALNKIEDVTVFGDAVVIKVKC